MLTTSPLGECWLAAMTDSSDGTQARLQRLPRRHLTALSAALAGVEDSEIARLLGIPPEAVPTTLRLAATKLLAALSEPASSDDI